MNPGTSSVQLMSVQIRSEKVIRYHHVDFGQYSRPSSNNCIDCKPIRCPGGSNDQFES